MYQTKHMKWSIYNNDYIIRNVPYEIIDSEEVIDLDTSVKVTALRDLMVEEDIPKDVDFNDFDEIEF